MPQQPLAQVPEDVEWFWQDNAACSGHDLALFFHPTNERGSTRMLRDRSAKRVCADWNAPTMRSGPASPSGCGAV